MSPADNYTSEEPAPKPVLTNAQWEEATERMWAEFSGEEQPYLPNREV